MLLLTAHKWQRNMVRPGVHYEVSKAVNDDTSRIAVMECQNVPIAMTRWYASRMSGHRTSSILTHRGNVLAKLHASLPAKAVWQTLLAANMDIQIICLAATSYSNSFLRLADLLYILMQHSSSENASFHLGGLRRAGCVL